MPKKRHNPLCRCRKSGAWTSRRTAEQVLERIKDEPPKSLLSYMPKRVVPCKSKRGVFHLTSDDGSPRRGRRDGAG